jgi:hypothetical protein
MLGAPGCGPPPAPVPLAIDIPTPAPAPVSHATAARPSATCVVGGKELHPRGDSLELCTPARRFCFGRISASSFVRPSLRSLVIDASLEAEIALENAGVTAWGVVEAGAIAIHARDAVPLGGWFVSDGRPVALLSVHADQALVDVPTGRDLTPGEPLHARWSCEALTSDRLRWDADDAVAAFGLGPEIAPPLGGAPPLLVSVTADGEPVARIDGDHRRTSRVFGRDGERLRVLVPVEAGFVVGWVDGARFESLQLGGSHRTRPPAVRMGALNHGTTCPHPVDIFVATPSGEVRVARVAANKPFAKDDLRMTLSMVFELSEGVTASIRAHDLVGCVTLEE